VGHPYAISGSGGGFMDRTGESVKEGDKVLYTTDGRKAILDEALHDGDAFVTFEDGSYGTVKWYNLVKIK